MQKCRPNFNFVFREFEENFAKLRKQKFRSHPTNKGTWRGRQFIKFWRLIRQMQNLFAFLFLMTLSSLMTWFYMKNEKKKKELLKALIIPFCIYVGFLGRKFHHRFENQSFQLWYCFSLFKDFVLLITGASILMPVNFDRVHTNWTYEVPVSRGGFRIIFFFLGGGEGGNFARHRLNFPISAPCNVIIFRWLYYVVPLVSVLKILYTK